MERRTALVASIATGVSLTVGVVAFAATGGASILGLGGGSSAGAGRAADPLVVHQVQTIEDEIVVSSRSPEVPRPVERSGATTTGAAPNAAPSFDGITVSIGPTAAAAANLAPVVPAGAAAPAALEATAPSTGPGAGDGSPAASTTPGASTAPSSSVNPTPASTNPPGSAPASTAPASTTPATTAPNTAPATTTPTSTTAARPPGVPADWPANQPIPPMPADCQQPQLEDNGVWNCDH